MPKTTVISCPLVFRLTPFASAVAAINRSPYKLYLFIDEYDNFAKEVMMGSQGQNQKRYTDLVSGEGMFKALFNC